MKQEIHHLCQNAKKRGCGWENRRVGVRGRREREREWKMESIWILIRKGSEDDGGGGAAFIAKAEQTNRAQRKRKKGNKGRDEVKKRK